MLDKEIVTDYDELSVRSDEMDVRKQGQGYKSTIYNLKQVVKHNKYLGLSGVQIGEPYRAFILNYNGELRSYCNPMVTRCNGDITLSREVCPSIPGKTYLVPRFADIDVAYQTPVGAPKTARLLGVAAFQFQHEMDHMEGILPCDIGLEIDDDFDSATDDEKVEIIKMFLESIDLKVKELNEDIQNDPDLLELDNAIKFMNAVSNGEVQIESVELTPEEIEQLKSEAIAELESESESDE